LLRCAFRGEAGSGHLSPPTVGCATNEEVGPRTMALVRKRVALLVARTRCDVTLEHASSADGQDACRIGRSTPTSARSGAVGTRISLPSQIGSTRPFVHVAESDDRSSSI
jgi:hypothetical protein